MPNRGPDLRFRRVLARVGRAITGLTALAWGVTALAARIDRPNIPRPTPTRPNEATDGVDALRVSIVLPARDEADAIGEAVRSHLRQTHTALELIVVDDGSTDGTAEVATRAAAGDPRFRVVEAGPFPRDGSARAGRVIAGPRPRPASGSCSATPTSATHPQHSRRASGWPTTQGVPESRSLRGFGWAPWPNGWFFPPPRSSFWP